MTSFTSDDMPVFKRLDPQVQLLYNEFMEHAEQCERDAAQHAVGLQLHQLMMGSAFPGLVQGAHHLVEQSLAMAQESRDLAYLLLKPDTAEIK